MPRDPRLFALTALTHICTRVVKQSPKKRNSEQPPFYVAKIASAPFFTTRLLPESSSLFAAIMAGKASTMALDEEAF